MEFRHIRWILALTLSATLAAFPLVLVLFLESPLDGTIHIAVFSFGTSWMMWLFGTAVPVAIAFRRQRAHPATFVVLGALLGYLFTLVDLVVVLRVMHSIAPSWADFGDLTEDVIVAALTVGVYYIPFGLFGGWLLWRIAVRPSIARAIAAGPMVGRAYDTLPRHERRLQDVRKLRLAISLLLAAAIPGIALIGIGIFVLGSTIPRSLVPSAAWTVIFEEITFLVLGFLYVGLIHLRSRNIRRAGCLWLGTILTCLFPRFACVLELTLNTPTGDTPPLGALGSATALSIVFIPLGLLAGWVIWAIGVRPASPPDLSPVFD